MLSPDVTRGVIFFRAGRRLKSFLSGSLSVDYGAKGKRVYRTGEAFMEAMDWWHDGSNDSDKPARVLVVFMGAKGHAPVIRDDAPAETPKP